jgi:hypothetical protein
VRTAPAQAIEREPVYAAPTRNSLFSRISGQTHQVIDTRSVGTLDSGTSYYYRLRSDRPTGPEIEKRSVGTENNNAWQSEDVPALAVIA